MLPPPSAGIPINEGVCSRCAGTGLIAHPDGSSEICPCGAWEKAQSRSSVNRARIPKRYLGKTLDSFENRKGDPVRTALKQGAKSWATDFANADRGLLLHGVTGCGKTHIAIGILHEVITRGHSGLYCNVTDLLTRLRHSYHSEAEEREERILEEADNVDLLVLDDMGAEAVTDWVRDRLYLIVNRRYESQKLLIVTTNCDHAELRERIGRRTASRLYEMCEDSFEFPHDDFRWSHLR